jgi:hypothetical protein
MLHLMFRCKNNQFCFVLIKLKHIGTHPIGNVRQTSLDTDEVQLESFCLNNGRRQTAESEDEDAPSTSKKPRYDHDFRLMNV